MLFTKTLLFALFAAVHAAPHVPRTTCEKPVVVEKQSDGVCSYPLADKDFALETYLGRWYQVAGTIAPFTAGCKCIFAQYSLNANGTVAVSNGCQSNEGAREITIRGYAARAGPEYGADGVFRVQFPGQPGPKCPGPNYIVQDYDLTNGWAIVQSQEFSTLFLLSREQKRSDEGIQQWLKRAERQGTDLKDVVKTDQTGCLYTS